MADATDAMSKLMSDALMVMLLSMTMSYLMLLTKLTRCTMMTDVQSYYLTLMWMLPSLLTYVVIDDAAPECTKIARFSAVAAAIFTAPPQNRAIFKAPRCAISSAKKIASERRISLRLKGTNLIPTAEFPAIPESAAKIASERRCAILVHSVLHDDSSKSVGHLMIDAVA